MSDPTDTGQRNPLSSSTSHASGTSARSVSSVQPDQAPAVMSMAAQDDVAAPAPLPHGEAGAPDDAEQHAEADPKSGAEAGSALEADSSPPEAAGGSDGPAAPAKEQQDVAYEPEAAAEFTYSPEPAAEAYAEYSQPVAELDAEDAVPNPGHQPLTAASEASDEVSALIDEPAHTAATDEPAYTAETAADVVSASPETPSGEDAAPDAPLPNELRAAARQTLADNEARQEQALALFDQVSRRFTAALEEAGVDAARVTFKVMEFAQASLKNNLELAKSYTAARSVPDVFGLHAAYIARQFELLNAQAEELREITAKFALRSTAAFKPHTDSTVKTLDN